MPLPSACYQRPVCVSRALSSPSNNQSCKISHISSTKLRTTSAGCSVKTGALLAFRALYVRVLSHTSRESAEACLRDVGALRHLLLHLVVWVFVLRFVLQRLVQMLQCNCQHLILHTGVMGYLAYILWRDRRPVNNP